MEEEERAYSGPSGRPSKKGKRRQKRSRKKGRKLDLKTMEWKNVATEEFPRREDKKGPATKEWYDGEEFLQLLEDEGEGKKAEEVLGTWRTEIEKGWVQVQSVMGSGASVPVAPPSMAPNATIRPSAGSMRGQKYITASKHKIPNLLKQLLHAATEGGDETQVLFQVAEVGRPLVSVSAICEQGNRVTFGRGGGMIQNLATGQETPFSRKNGIYVLNMWILDADAPCFHRP